MTPFKSFIVKSMVTLLVGSGTLATNLQAQNDAMTVSVPYSFTVGAQSIAPGTYQFSLLSSQFVLSVRNVNTGNKYIFIVHPEQQNAVEQHGRLVFRNSEGCRLLNEIHFPRTNLFSDVSQSRVAGRIEAKTSSTNNSTTVARR